MLGAPVSLRRAIEEGATLLAGGGVESPRWDAEQLAAHVLGVSRTSLPVIPNLTAEQYATFHQLVGRRAGREPLQHIVGTVGFRYIELAVGPGVFVPRPETEDVAGYAVDAARAAGARAVVVDLCAGSGAIALSVAKEATFATVHAVEKDPAALEWLRRNAAARVEAGDNPVAIHEADVADALPELDGTVDVVVSNPPYVPLADLTNPQPEILHDPAVALAAGADGLDVIRTVERTAHRLLKPGGVVAVEHGESQGTTAPALFDAARWRDVTDRRDLVGRPRYVTATKMDA